MKKRIEYAELRAMGASERLLEHYSVTSPMDITERDGVYTVTGVMERQEYSQKDLLETLEDFFSDMENINITALENYCREWLGESGFERFADWSLRAAQSDLDIVAEDFPGLTAQELYETMRDVLTEAWQN